MLSTALISGMINVLASTSSFFMLRVYGRVIASRSIPTLIGLLVPDGLFFVDQGGLQRDAATLSVIRVPRAPGRTARIVQVALADR